MSKRLVQYKPQWQALRVSMLAEHNDLGGFTTPEGTSDNITKMTKYILETMPFSQYSENWSDQSGLGLTMYEECQMRHFRVLNMLAAVRMGYSGQGLTGSEMDELVARFRRDVQFTYDDRTVEDAVLRVGEKAWWDAVARELRIQATTDPVGFLKVKWDLEKRWATAYKKVGERATKTRSELLKYLEMLNSTT